MHFAARLSVPESVADPAGYYRTNVIGTLTLLEAMASDLPVLAFAAAAVPETLGGAGIAFTEKHIPTLVEVVFELCEDAPLRRRILAGQRRRLSELSASGAQGRLATALASIGISPPRAFTRRRRRRS